MIESVSAFSDQLNRLDPHDVEFVLRVDELVEQTSPETLEVAYSAIFRFFEAHPEDDCETPWTLIHLMEDYYPNYVDTLVESIKRTPSMLAVLMVNRILNSEDADSELQNRLLSCLREVTMRADVSPLVKEEAQQYLKRHSQ